MDSLANKTLVMIVGPAAIGKTTLMNKVVELNDDFAYVRSFTTRRRRENELSHYDFISRDEALSLQQKGKTITFFEHPTTGDIYGTTAASFPARYNLLDTLSTTVPSYRQLPFVETTVISLTAQADEWRSWFTARYPLLSNEANKRLEEAAQSIRWSLSDTTTHWLLNPVGKTRHTAKQLVELVTLAPAPSSPPVEAERILALIDRGIY